MWVAHNRNSVQSCTSICAARFQLVLMQPGSELFIQAVQEHHARIRVAVGLCYPRAPGKLNSDRRC